MSAPPPAATPVETKVVASSGTAIFVGLLTWALVTYIPAFRGGIPPDLQPFIPVAAAWLASTYAAYRAPHTPRPDLLPPVIPPAAPPAHQDPARLAAQLAAQLAALPPGSLER